jgi:hypothetical protein
MKDEPLPTAKQVQRRLSGGQATLATGKENGSPATNGRATRSRKA